MDGFSSPLNMPDVIKISINTASAVYKYANNIKNAKSDMKELGGEINAHLSILGKAKDLLKSQSVRLQASQGLRSALDANYSKLASIKCQLDEELTSKSSLRKRRRIIEYDIENLRKSREDIGIALSIDNANITMGILCTQSDDILSKLPAVQGAAFDDHANEHEPRCYPGTRVKILGDIGKWAQEPDGRRIYWLCGMAGTGKSTICRTISHHLTSLNIVTASFFKKGDDNRDKSSALFTTIVKQLVEHVQQALQDNPSISDKTLGKQFEKLILKPLKSCKTLPPVIVVVMDALDECEDQASAAKIIELLPGVETVSSTCFKVLVSSRPECHLRKSFAQLECKYHEIFLYEALHEVADEIRDNYKLTNLQLPADWPSESLVKDLVNISVPLFILAATACRYIDDKDPSDPVTLAQEFLQHHRQLGKGNPLSRTYLPILDQLLVRRSETVSEDRSEAEKEKIIREFRRVVGTIVLLEAPLSITSLSELLQMNPRNVHLRLSGLNAVLNIPKDPNSSVKLFHLSFRDFLIGTGDQVEKHDFLVNEQETHGNLARQCIALLSRDDNLKQDICEFNRPGILRSNIGQGTIDTYLSSHVRYACLHWVFHLKESRGCILVDDETHHFLTKHLIHWLEALSLLGRIVESIDMIESLLAMSDAIPKWIKHQPAVPMEWDLCLQTLGHNEDTYQAVLSPDSSLIASRGPNKVLIWRFHTGTRIHEIEANFLTTIASSCDSKLFYSVSQAGEIKSWETDTWTCKTIMTVDSTATEDAKVHSAAISHNCKLVAVASATGIEIRSISSTGDSIKSIKTQQFNFGINLVFSPDSAYIAAESLYRLEIWRVGSEESTLIEDCSAMAYSPDSSLIALGLENAIEIRCIGKGSLKLHRKFSLKDGYEALDLTFSHDAALLAIGLGSSSLEFHKLGIWLTDTGECIWTVNDHTDGITSLLFSHDSTFLVSSSYDGNLRIYSVNKHGPSEIHELEHEQAGPVTISPDSSLILLEPGRGNNIWQVLRADSGLCIEEFDRDKLQSEPTFVPDSALAVIKDGAAEIWHPDRRCSVQNLNGLGSHPSAIRAACFSADFTLVAGILDDRSLRIWQMNTGTCMRAIKSAVPDYYHPKTLCFTPEASRIACASEIEEQLFVWQVESDLPAQNILLWNGVGCFALSNTKLAVASENEVFRIWSLETGRVLQVLGNDVSIAKIQKLAFSYDSMLLASAKPWETTYEHTVDIRNADTGALVQVIGLGLDITHLFFEPNNNLVLRTNLGRIKLKGTTALGEDAAGVGQSQPWCYDRLGWRNDSQEDNGWITFNGEKLLWLPAKYRGRLKPSRAVSDSVVAIVPHKFGQHVFIGFDMERISRWHPDTH
ncbi:WD40 repeat-like protein [Trichoderma evansii]